MVASANNHKTALVADVKCSCIDWHSKFRFQNLPAMYGRILPK
jgi:hypothetical protein